MSRDEQDAVAEAGLRSGGARLLGCRNLGRPSQPRHDAYVAPSRTSLLPNSSAVIACACSGKRSCCYAMPHYAVLERLMPCLIPASQCPVSLCKWCRACAYALAPRMQPSLSTCTRMHACNPSSSSCMNAWNLSSSTRQEQNARPHTLTAYGQLTAHIR
jgi:hypothetical protein